MPDQRPDHPTIPDPPQCNCHMNELKTKYECHSEASIVSSTVRRSHHPFRRFEMTVKKNRPRTVSARFKAAKKRGDKSGFRPVLHTAIGLDCLSVRLQELQRLIEQHLRRDREKPLGELLDSYKVLVNVCNGLTDDLLECVSR
jgi:hypothetical protein